MRALRVTSGEVQPFAMGLLHGEAKLDKPWRLSRHPTVGSRGALAGVEESTFFLLLSSLIASATAKMKALGQTGS